jgi:hypothetical protein
MMVFPILFLGGGAQKITLPEVLFGKAHCSGSKSICQAKDLDFFFLTNALLQMFQNLKVQYLVDCFFSTKQASVFMSQKCCGVLFLGHTGRSKSY